MMIAGLMLCVRRGCQNRHREFYQDIYRFHNLITMVGSVLSNAREDIDKIVKPFFHSIDLEP